MSCAFPFACSLDLITEVHSFTIVISLNQSQSTIGLSQSYFHKFGGLRVLVWEDDSSVVINHMSLMIVSG
jgi:hypothetical protein